MAHKKKGNKNKPLNKKQLTPKVAEIFTREPSKGFNYKQIAKALDIRNDDSRKLINTVMYEMKEAGFLKELYTGKFQYHSKGAYVTGKVDLTSWGSAYIISDDVLEDIFVSKENLKSALHGDKVKVYVHARRKRKKAEGEVVEILEPGKVFGNIEAPNVVIHPGVVFEGNCWTHSPKKKVGDDQVVVIREAKAEKKMLTD